jgi:ankyrin repeat protein
MLPLFEFDPITSKKDLEELPTKEQASAKRRNQDHKSSPPSSPTSVRHSNKKQKSASAAEKAKVVKPVNDDPHHEHHRSILMNIFLTDDPNYTPNILTSSLLTHDINIDLVIDEQGHTALHWASALGRPKVVDLLISNGANVCRVNYDGQTPLMRSVMITCAYENKCFPELVEMMQDAVSIIDNQGRTVLHHIALTAGVQGYSDAATYYMKHLLSGLSSNGKLRQIINIKDKNHSESVMGIAIRLECEEIINLLSAYGAIVGVLIY